MIARKTSTHERLARRNILNNMPREWQQGPSIRNDRCDCLVWNRGSDDIADKYSNSQCIVVQVVCYDRALTEIYE